MHDVQYHSHVWASITSAKHPSALADVEGLHVLGLSDSMGIGSPQQLSLSLPGRVKKGRVHVPLRELLSVGDLLRIGGHIWDGKTGEVYTLAEDAIITDIQTSESFSNGVYSFTTTISADGLQSQLLTDAVAWWMYYGTEVGALQARFLTSDQISGDLGKIFATYLDKVSFHFANWGRDGIGLKDRFGYHLKSLIGNAPILTGLTVAEGSHWSILSQFADAPLHEFFVQNRKEKDPARPMTGGWVHHPTYKAKPLLSSEDAPQFGSGHRPYVVLRAAPFPYADKNGQPVMKEWEALPLHDLTGVRAVVTPGSFGNSMSGVRNFVMVFPSYDMMNDEMSFTTGLAVLNRDSITRYGYRPFKTRSLLVLKDNRQVDFMDFAKELTWRVAGQMNRLDEMLSGSLTVPFAPAVQPGDRVRFHLIHTDGTVAGIHEGYVTSRSHSYTLGQGTRTSLSLERVLPESVYKSPQWFVQGLSAVQVKPPSPRTSDDPAGSRPNQPHITEM